LPPLAGPEPHLHGCAAGDRGIPGEFWRPLFLTGDADYPPLTCTAPAGMDPVISHAAGRVLPPKNSSQRSET